MTYTHDFNVGYSFSYRLKGETNWVYTRGKDANDNSRWGPNNTTIQFNRPGIYEIRVEARQGIDISIVQSMILPNYVVSERDENIIYSNAGIRSCNKILVYLNRLWLYGDTSEPDFVYIADIDNPVTSRCTRLSVLKIPNKSHSVSSLNFETHSLLLLIQAFKGYLGIISRNKT